MLALALVALIALPASATGPVTRLGMEYSGIRNPGGCEVGQDDVHPTELRVQCTGGVGASGQAFVRFRFLADVGAVLGPATVSADLRDPEGCASYRWMAPIRTMRIDVPFGCYIHVRSVTWQQP
jgi:hypothetical protein